MGTYPSPVVAPPSNKIVARLSVRVEQTLLSAAFDLDLDRILDLVVDLVLDLNLDLDLHLDLYLALDSCHPDRSRSASDGIVEGPAVHFGQSDIRAITTKAKRDGFR